MSRNVLTVEMSESCHEAATRMFRGRIRHLPVVDRRGVLAGVVTVKSSIRNVGEEDEMSTTTKSDVQIQQDVLRELACDPRVEEAEVGVSVQDGVVTLSGTVTSWAKRMAGQEAAHRVTGVLDVANDITVKLSGGLVRSDTEIAHAVRQALEWDVFVPDTRIQSTVSNGWVTLMGTVDAVSEREDAERAVRNLIGVRGVLNQISVSQPRIAPERIRTAIEEALERRAEREARRIDVTVSPDGEVTLGGRVRSWAEREAVVASARYLRGVRAVKDRLRIDAAA
jgi:osmotically-inducible protein OsmY